MMANDPVLNKYLSKYHYISPSQSGNHDVQTAIQNFQRIAGLPVTGQKDQATVRQMEQPRCIMSDMDDDGLRLRRSVDQPRKWERKHLTYFVEYGRDLKHDEQDSIFARALKYWADVSGLSFAKTSNDRSADLKISFGFHTHGGDADRRLCGYPFDGPGNVLAHAFLPSDGRVHFDDAEDYTDGTSYGTNLLWVATHEFGHALGLQHSDVRDAVMYPYYSGYVPNFKLHQDDINEIQARYGRGTDVVVQQQQQQRQQAYTKHHTRK